MKKLISTAILIIFLSLVSYSQQVDKDNKENSLQTSKKVQKKSTIKQLDIRVIASSKYQHIEQYRIENNVPDDFPKYVDTGNPKVDNANYYEEKQKWIKKNPGRFEKIKHLNL